MAKKKRDEPNSGIHIEGSTVRIGGDAVGRDKIEHHYGDNPDAAWGEFYAGSFLAKALIAAGVILLAAGFLGFFGSILYTFFSDFPSFSFERISHRIPFIAASFGGAVVGMLLLVTGRAMASNRAYRQRGRDRKTNPK